MKELEISGAGCSTCRLLADAVNAVIAAEKHEASDEKVEKIR